jgi:ABC-type lipoprotein export system ATPase subunit
VTAVATSVGPLVRCTAVGRAYGSGPTTVAAVRRADCELWPSMQVAVTGRSGSGKSTLLHLLGGLDRPTSGRVSWPGLGSDPRDLLPGTVGVVFQGPSLIQTLDVTENVALPLILGGNDDKSAREAASAALGAVGVEALAPKLPDELSGGQAQRVAVARALVGRPQVILADEPTGQLDRHNADQIVDALIDAVAGTGAGLVIATHDERVAARLPTRWIMADGLLHHPAWDTVC